MGKTRSVNCLSDPTIDRYRRVKEEARQRMDVPELTNDELMALMLDVYEYHLEPHDDQGMDTKAVLLDGP